MKNQSTKDMGSTLWQRILSLLLAIVMLGNLSVEAAGVSRYSASKIRQQVEEKVAQYEQTSPSKTPQQFLKDLREEMEKAFTDSTPAEPAPQKKTEQAYAVDYSQEVNNQYKAHIKKFDQDAKAAISDFEHSAQAAYEEYKALLADDPNAQNRLAEYRDIIQAEKEKYVAEIASQKDQFVADLNNEKAAFMADMPNSYQRYSRDFDLAVEQAAKAQLEFYKDIVNQIVINYKQTQDQASKENFVSLITYLSSFQNRNQFITGSNKKYITETLQGFFVGNRKACQGHAETQYADNASWGTAGMGGSPSAGRVYDVGVNRKQVFRLDNEASCNLAISAMIPFANLDGNGFAISYFLQENMDNPMFGQILLVGAKALSLTNNKGLEGLSRVVDKSIETENTSTKKTFWSSMDLVTGEGLARYKLFNGKYMSHNVSMSAKREVGEPSVWEDVARILVEKNNAQADAILAKAVEQCRVKVSGRYPNEKQYVECKGVYPFLFGVITQKPELTSRLNITPRVNDQPGQEIDATGRIRTVSTQEAAQRRAYNEKHDITRQYTKGDLLGRYFYLKFFEDLYPADKQRMDSLIAQNATLNSQQELRAYAASSSDETYKQLEEKFNVSTVIVGAGGIFDMAITMLLIKNLGSIAFRLGTMAKNISNAAKIRRVILEYKHIPASMSKSLKIAHGLQARGVSVAQLQSHRAFLAKTAKIKKTVKTIPQLRSKIIVKLSAGQVPPMPNMQPRRHTNVAHHLRGRQMGKRVKFNTSLSEPAPLANAAFAGGTAPVSGWAQVKAAFHDAWNWMNPKATMGASKSSTTFKVDDLTVVLKDKKGKPVKITDVRVEDGTLYINNQMAKTYKAYMPVEQLDALAALTKEEKVALGFDGMWIKLVDNSASPSYWEKVRSLNQLVETVPLYNQAGVEIMQVGFNAGYKAQKALLTSIKNGARLVFKEGKIYLQENGGFKLLDQFTQISLPKTAMNNLIKGKHTSFLTRLFTMEDKGAGALNIVQTPSKTFWPLAVNFLSYSASASALMLTLEQEPFNWTPAASMAVGMVLPYISSPLAPLLSPLVKRVGARRVMTGSLWLASGSLGLSMLTGWRGHGQDKDAQGNMKGSFGVLLANAALTGLASTGIRASSNVMIKAYETGARTTTVSMAYKSVGALSMTLIPAVQHGVNKAVGLGKERDWDFSGAYWAILPISVATALGLRFTMPNMAKPGYKLSRAEFSAPWKLLARKEVWPYVGGITLMSALEGYGYFKGVSAWERDEWKKTGWDSSYVKFAASVTTALPQLALRAWSPRKAFFGRGMFNSALAAMTGAGLFMLPTQDWGKGANLAVGALSGILLGSGTAQVFQYNQKLVGAAVKAAYGEELVPTAIVLHSGGNFGLALPIIPALVAGQRKKELNEGEVQAAKNTTWIPLSGYGVGIGLIALAEHGLAPHLSILTRPVFKGLSYAGRLIPPVVGIASIMNKTIQPPAKTELLPEAAPNTGFLREMPQPVDLKITTQPALKTKARYSLGTKASFRPQPAQ